MDVFSFKNLLIWQKSMVFTEVVMDITERIQGHYRLMEQLESSAASIPQNIAEGKGRVSTKEFIHFLYIARGSLYEAVTILNLLGHKKLITETELENLEMKGLEITKMLNSFISKEREKLKT